MPELITLPDAEWVERLGPVAGAELAPWDLTDAPERPGEIAFVVPPYLGHPPLDRLGDLPALRVVQLLTAGFDRVLPHVPPGVQLANAVGVHDASTAELAVALTLASLRGIPEFVQAQAEGRWLPQRMWPALADRRVLIVGYGGIGRAVARRLAPFEVSIRAVASRARDGDELVPLVHGVDELPDLLPHQDVVIVVVPLTAATTGLVDADFLAAMPDGAVLVNVARGRVVDTDALVAATASGRLRAALDVTEPEPLPAGHPLWSTPGVLISPHVGGASSAFAPRALSLVRAQVEAFVQGRPLQGVVHAG